MKVQCIKNMTKADAGLIFGIGKKPELPIAGLTIGKVYDVQVVSVVGGQIYGHGGEVSSQMQFYLFNDDSIWELYDPALFIPE